MKAKIDLSPKYLAIVQEILQKNLPSTAIVWAFGSRVKGNVKKFSDLDLAIDNGAKISSELMAKIDFDLEQSNLPYKVDVVDWHAISDNFKSIIENDRVVIWPRKFT